MSAAVTIAVTSSYLHVCMYTAICIKLTNCLSDPQKGEIIISRFYRDDVTKSAANTFRMEVIARKETGTHPPVKMTEGNSFFYTRHRCI